MSKFTDFIDEYRAGKISAFDLYQNLPLDMQKSVETVLAKGKTDKDEDDKDQNGNDDDIGDALFGDEEEDLDKTNGTAGVMAASPTPTGQRQPPGVMMSSLGEFSALRASLRQSPSAQKNYVASQYGTETVRKSGVGSPCIICKKLHKSVGNWCESCGDAFRSSTWHKNSHLE